MFGGEIIRKKIKVKIESIEEKTNEEYEVFSIINKNKITYKKDEVKYTLIISENSITLIRESEDFKNILTFKEKRSILSEYIIKSNDMVLEINVETLALKNTSKEILISLTNSLGACSVLLHEWWTDPGQCQHSSTFQVDREGANQGR